jgi:hypothetical protein
MNCFSSGREVRRRCKSVPRSSVTRTCQRSEIQEGWRVHLPTYMSSRGEMKMSLKLMTCYLFSEAAHAVIKSGASSYVLMAQVLQELQLAVCALGQNGCAERLHDLLDCDGRRGELILCGTVCSVSYRSTSASIQTTHQTRPKAPMPTGCKSEYLTSRLAHAVPLRCAYDVVVFVHTCS